MNCVDASLHRHIVCWEHPFSLYITIYDIRTTIYDLSMKHGSKATRLVFTALIQLYCKILFLDCVVLFKGLYIGFVSDIPLINNGNTI